MNATFFKFLFGFLAILFVSFIVTGVAAHFSNKTIDTATQPACDQGTAC